jgi:hypothetical protein
VPGSTAHPDDSNKAAQIDTYALEVIDTQNAGERLQRRRHVRGAYNPGDLYDPDSSAFARSMHGGAAP